ncbi:MAG: tRNA (N(6)-L-threonylcarbamoyladenosine(37)-C(2))-methylthiotransferase MtaB [Lachnospiraceae bacterium]|nr:tRNA (N(6)-L-threonylcarbamoyladenosine(37)-C(2))-methylthiotransferase MtaB [Lachnospiraceae bacterium]
MKKAAFHNLGCKVNSYELDIMRQILRDRGYLEVPFHEQADVYVVNTCTVTNIADRKSRQMLHRAKKQNPDAVVVAVGCYVETDPDRVERDDAIDLVIGNNRKTQIGDILTAYLAERKVIGDRAEVVPEGKPSWREDLTAAPQYEAMRLTDPGHTRAYIKIQDGCNQFCSYCIIPYARGRIRSRQPEEILQEVRDLVAGGIREIVLTGIHVSSYGLDFGAEGPVRFDPFKSGQALLSLLRGLSAVEGLERIRMSSLEPRIMTERFIRELSALDKVCPHFHLSLQSGCDATLRRMNRHYTTAEYARSVDLLRRYYDRPAITTDVIVGFPGETEEEFEQTCAFLERIRFYEIHVFRYSRRSGTVADKMPDQVPEPVKARRSERLLALTADQAAAYRAQFAGEPETILLEETCEQDGLTYWTGSTARYVTAAVPADVERAYRPGMLLGGTFRPEEIGLSRGSCLLFVPEA